MVVFVNPKNTTQECSNCHQIVKKELSERIHDCPYCGLVTDRDLNAAQNILNRGLRQVGQGLLDFKPLGKGTATDKNRYQQVLLMKEEATSLTM